MSLNERDVSWFRGVLPTRSNLAFDCELGLFDENITGYYLLKEESSRVASPALWADSVY